MRNVSRVTESDELGSCKRPPARRAGVEVVARQTLPEPLNERAQRLLRVLIEHYIREGNPVGSRTLSKGSGLAVSPATVRNIMADLEDLGFVAAPHTSAGRVPTIKGYRFFVDSLMKLRPPRGAEVKQLERDLQAAIPDPKSLAESASTLLSSLTHLAGVVTVPRRRHAALRQIEFLPLSGDRVLAILVVNDREVHNSIISVQRTFTESELRQASNYLTEMFAGRDLSQVREALVHELAGAKASVEALMQDALEIAEQALQTPTDSDYIVAGEVNLMDADDLADVDKLKRLFEAFNRKRDMLHLLDQTLRGDGVQIFIGQESGYQVLDDCSVVTARYDDGDGAVGVLGVIGPTRMAYERVIPIVDITAKLLGSALNSDS